MADDKQNPKIREATVDTRSLTKELKKLTAAVTQTADVYRQLAVGSKSLALQTAKVVSDYHDLLDVVGAQNEFQAKIISKYKEQTKPLSNSLSLNEDIAAKLEEQFMNVLKNDQYLDNIGKTQAEIINSLSKIAAYNSADLATQEKIKAYITDILNTRAQELKDVDALNILNSASLALAQSQAANAADTAASTIEEFKTTNGLVDASDALVQLKYEEKQLVDKIGGAEGKVKEIMLEALKLLQEQVITQTTLDAKVKEKLHLLEQEKIKRSAINSLEEKSKELLGNAGEEILEIGRGLKESMISPLGLIGALLGSALSSFKDLGEYNKNFLETSKLNVSQADHLFHFAHDLSTEYRDQGLEYKNILESAGALVNQYGSMNRLTDKTVENVSLLGKAFGVSAENAAGTVYQLQAATGLSAEAATNIAALGANFAKAAGVAPDVIFQDIAQSSEAIATYFKGSAGELLKAAVESRRLGLSIQKVADISRTLLDFETSIDDQMSASVLLGRNINLDKARQLALDGKILEAAEETLNQVGSLADFNKMNAIQKEAIAKAAGMTVADLQQSLEKQEALKNMTSAQRAEYDKGLNALSAANKMTGERLLKEQRNQITQQKIADAVTKLSEIFANTFLPAIEQVAGVFGDILGFIGKFPGLIQLITIGFIASRTASFLFNKELKLSSILLNSMSKIKGFGSSIINGFKSIVDWTKKLIFVKKIDTVTTNLNSAAQKLNASQLDYFKKLRSEGVPALKAFSAAKDFDTKKQIANNAATLESGVVSKGAAGPLASFGAALLEVGAGALMVGGAVAAAGAGIYLADSGVSALIDSFTKFGSTIIPMIIGNIESLSKHITDIFELAAAFSALALSIGALGVASAIALPTLAVVGGVAAAVGTVMEPGPKIAAEAEGSSSVDAEKFNQLMDKLDTLIKAINSQPIELKVNGSTIAEVTGRNTQRSYAPTK